MTTMTMTTTKITVLTLTRGDVVEEYYEHRLPQRVVRILREKGWTVRTRRVSAEDYAAQLDRRAAEADRASASLVGASSATFGYGLMAALLRGRAAECRAVAAGAPGTLTDR